MKTKKINRIFFKKIFKSRYDIAFFEIKIKVNLMKKVNVNFIKEILPIV